MGSSRLQQYDMGKPRHNPLRPPVAMIPIARARNLPQSGNTRGGSSRGRSTGRCNVPSRIRISRRCSITRPCCRCAFCCCNFRRCRRPLGRWNQIITRINRSWATWIRVYDHAGVPRLGGCLVWVRSRGWCSSGCGSCIGRHSSRRIGRCGSGCGSGCISRCCTIRSDVTGILHNSTRVHRILFLSFSCTTKPQEGSGKGTQRDQD